MSFSDFIDESRQLVSDALESLGYPRSGNLEWAEPREAEYGDLSFRVGFQLAKESKKKPSQIASEIADWARGSLSTKKYIESVEAHQSGFLNLRIKDERFLPDVLVKARAEGYGRIRVGEGKRVLVEHTSVNPSKALHVGHLRNTAIGDSLARIFSFASYETNVLNYIDDSGLQVADVIVGMKYLGFPEEAPEGRKYDHYAGDPVYTEVTKRYETDPGLKEKQSLVLKQIEERDPSVIDLVLRVTENILREQLNTCWRFGAFYDLLVYESDIIGSKLWEELFSELKKNGIAKFETEGKLAGCWVVTVKGESEGEDKVLVRSNGTATYVAKDTPFAALKMGLIEDRFSYAKYTTQPNGKVLFRTGSGVSTVHAPLQWGPDRSFTPIDNRQGRLQRIIQYILSELAKQDMRDRYVHVGYEIVSLTPRTAEAIGIREESVGDNKKMITMAGRKGLFVNADDAIEALKRRAIEETVKRNPDNKDLRWVDEVGEAIAVSALRFQLLRQDLDKIIVFDLEDSLKLVGETGPYLLYTYARATSIVAKATDSDKSPVASYDSHIRVNESEKNLLRLISKFDIAVERAVKMVAPKWVAHYSYDVCDAFNKFYETNRVLQEPDPKLRKQRLDTVEATRNVLRQSLELLGIRVLEKI